MSTSTIKVEPDDRASAATSSNIIRKVLVAAAGNLLEWYDFAVFGLFAHEISENFFPCSDAHTGLIQTFAIYAGGFLVRPIGGVLFGHIGDRHGREVALIGTIFTMAAPTLCIGLLPSYDTIGPAAPVLLACFAGYTTGKSLCSIFCEERNRTNA